MHTTEHEVLLDKIKYVASDLDIARELVKYIPIARETARAMKAERKLENDLSDGGLKTLTKMFDMDQHAGTEYALKMTLRSFRSETIT